MKKAFFIPMTHCLHQQKESAMWADIIDTSRTWLHRLTERLGEGGHMMPSSLKKERLAQASISLDLPSIVSLLPYESMDEDLLFINKRSMGFGLHVMPAAGADETLVKSMAELIKNKLPVGVDCTVMLYRHHYVNAAIECGFDPMMNQGGIYQQLAQMSEKYHLKAAIEGYPNGRNIAAKLSDYRVYLFFSVRHGADASLHLNNLRRNIESELNVAGLAHARLEQHDFLVLMRTLLCPQLKSMNWPEVHLDLSSPLSHAIPSGNSLFSAHDLSVDCEGSDTDGHPFKTRIINCHIEKWPDELALWQTPDLFANLLRPEQGIPCSGRKRFANKSGVCHNANSSGHFSIWQLIMRVLNGCPSVSLPSQSTLKSCAENRLLPEGMA